MGPEGDGVGSFGEEIVVLLLMVVVVMSAVSKRFVGILPCRD